VTSIDGGRLDEARVEAVALVNSARLPPCERRFEALVFDWDGTAVPDRNADASEVRELIEELCAAGAYVAIVSGTHVDNIDGQLGARPGPQGRLVLALNRGSEVFIVEQDGPRLHYRRDASSDEDAALDAAAALTVARLAERGLGAEIVSQRLNRRKIDLIPLPEWSDPPKARIGSLLDAVEQRLFGVGLGGLADVVEIATSAARDAGLGDPRVTSDVKHVEIGLTDKSDSARWIFADLWSRGLGASLVLVGGDEFGSLGGLRGSDAFMLVDEAARATVVSVGVEPAGVPDGVHGLRGGPDTFVALLADQYARRIAKEPPRVDEQTAWSLTIDRLDSVHERADEARLTISDGWLATNGSPLIAHPAGAPRTLVSGVYDGEGSETSLLAAPDWHRLSNIPSRIGTLRRTLDFRTAVLVEESTGGATIRSVRFEPLGARGVGVLRAAYDTDGAEPPPLLAPADVDHVEEGSVGDRQWMRVVGSHGGIVAAARQLTTQARDGTTRLDRVVAYEADPVAVPNVSGAVDTVDRATALGFERLLGDHRAEWAARWADCDVVIEGDDALQQAVRFALFHLHGAAGDAGEAAVGARGLTGSAYRGHVFWDADVFVLPFLVATRPSAARAMLEYRVRRLPAARAAARTAGYEGARFPWESARAGGDVTPRSARDQTGRLVPIRTGQLEDHIVADVAWAAAWYVEWTGDDAFARGPGREILLETARYWASRIRTEADGSAHIFGVIGPDEYHEPVDDNVFTNVMARWNLRRAAATVGSDVDASEVRRWLELAEAIVDGYDSGSGVYEEFAGFHGLEPLMIADLAPRRPVAADLLLGRERVQGAQVVKQADVLMAHHLVPDEMAPGSLEANLRFYEPRTAHGSSLSPGVHAALFARAGDTRRALEALRMAARVDLDDLNATTADGLHLATLGTVWQAIVLGFAGLRPDGHGALAVDPHLPAEWSSLEVTVRFRGRRVRLRNERGVATIESDGSVRARAGANEFEVSSAGTRLVHGESGWEIAP
jgi:trehalose/maltose hydrolase-like predicted phosphorylase